MTSHPAHRQPIDSPNAITINVEPWIGNAIDDLDARYAYSDTGFNGDRLYLRWSLRGRTDGWQSVCLYAPTEEEAVEAPRYAGRYWMGWELQGRSAGPQDAPAWEIDLELGAHPGEAGLHVAAYFVSFPSEPFAETLHAAHHRAATAREWDALRDTLLDGRLAELARRIDAEADFARSAESTDNAEEEEEDYYEDEESGEEQEEDV